MMHFIENTDMAQIVSPSLSFALWFIHRIFILRNVRELSEGLCIGEASAFRILHVEISVVSQTMAAGRYY